jgi:hypothetical protein
MKKTAAFVVFIHSSDKEICVCSVGEEPRKMQEQNKLNAAPTCVGKLVPIIGTNINIASQELAKTQRRILKQFWNGYYNTWNR